MQDNETDKNEEISQEFIDSLFAQGPQLTNEQVNQLEDTLSSKEFNQMRFLTLVLLSKSMKQLCEIGERNPDMHAEAINITDEFLIKVKSMLELAESSAMRLRVADCKVKAVVEEREKTLH